MSFAQESVWLAHQLDPTGAAYNVAGGVRLRGPVDADLLGACLRELVGRHEPLRTTYTLVDGVPRQVVHEELMPAIDRLDASERVDDELREIVRAPLRLDDGPVMRAAL